MYRFTWEWGLLEGLHQISNDFLTKLFLVFTQFGGEILLIAVIGLFYFCLNKEKGEKIGFIVLFSGAFNGVLKGMVKAKRPFEYPEKEHLIKGSVGSTNATGSSFPSGHSQNSASLYSTLSKIAKKKWLTIVCIVLIVIVPLSRVYLGVHFPVDVIAGVILGVLTSIFIIFLYSFLAIKKISPFWMYLVAAIGLIPFLILTPHQDLFKVYGLLLGFVSGLAIEKTLIGFSLEVPLWKKILRMILALGIVLGIKEGLKLVFPDKLIFSLLRYFFITFFAIGVYPLVLKNKFFPHGL